jgi:hypothetical protein
MERIHFHRWTLACDLSATRQAYNQIEMGDPEVCGCCYCRNFILARDQVYPSEILDLLNRLGVDSRREREVYHMGRLPNGLHHYGGWFHFVGSIELEGTEVGPYDMENQEGRFQLWFHSQPALVPKPFNGLPVCQMEFVAGVPWLLRDHPEP